MPSLSYLAIGDSYTIGEGVPLSYSFPYQLVQLLRQKEWNVCGPEVIARTGWTTDELLRHLSQTLTAKQYGLVTLLIGVNNQYRGMSTDSYQRDFSRLLETCMTLTAQQPKHIYVLSIPDWSKTPFAEGRDTQMIAREIGCFNAINAELSGKIGANYVDITHEDAGTLTDLSWLAEDQLHPSGKTYARWARLLASNICGVAD